VNGPETPLWPPVRMSRLPGTISVIRPAVVVGVVMVGYVVVAATVSGLVWLGH
jgi:hypothetical protein